MKKNVLKIVGLAVLLTFSNCTSDSRSNLDITPTETSANVSTLKNNLTKFNKDFKYKTNTNLNLVGKKKWWQTALQVAAIATGDASGAAAGVWAVQGLAGAVGAATAGTGYAVVSGVAGVIGAAGGSYAAYCSTGGHCRGRFNNVDPRGASVTYDFPTKYDYIENFGTLHNSALANMYLSENNVSEQIWVENNIPNINEVNYNVLLGSGEYINLKNNINSITDNYKASNYDVEKLLNDYLNKGLINQNVKDILSLYFSATIKAETFEDYRAITDRYVAEIQNSNLMDREKESLLASFSVSIQSYYYWLNLEVE